MICVDSIGKRTVFVLILAACLFFRFNTDVQALHKVAISKLHDIDVPQIVAGAEQFDSRTQFFGSLQFSGKPIACTTG